MGGGGGWRENCIREIPGNKWNDEGGGEKAKSDEMIICVSAGLYLRSAGAPKR